MAAPRRLHALGWVLGLVALALVGGQVWRHRDQVVLALSGLSAWRLLAALGIGLLAQLLFAAAWHVLLGERAGRPPFRGNLSRWLVTLGGKYLPGKIWQGVGRVAMYGGELPAAHVAATYVREMLLSTSAACAVGASHGLAYGSFLGPASWGLAAAAVALALLAHPSLAARLQRWLPARLRPVTDGQAPAATGRLVLGWGLQLAGYLALGAALVLMAGGMLATDAALAWAIVSALCLGGIAGIAAFFVPAGLGVREAMLAGYLVQYLGAGEAGLLALVARAWLTLTEALAIAIGLALARKGRAP